MSAWVRIAYPPPEKEALCLRRQTGGLAPHVDVRAPSTAPGLLNYFFKRHHTEL
jgi:hypothetical protein